MNTDHVHTEKRDVSGFDQVALTGFGELVIKQGEEESLTIEAPQDILSRIETEVVDGKLIIGISRSWLDWIGDMLSAGFAGKRVFFDLEVKQLTSLEILGAGRVRASKIESDRLALELRGAAEVNIESIEAKRLKVSLPGAGKIGVSGRVAEQTISIRGAGSYDAPRLESQKAKATLEGFGSATIWAAEELDVVIRGVGSLSYYGSPKVSTDIAGPGSVNSLGNP